VFSAGFYEGLAAGESVGQAFESGRVALSLELDEDSQGQAEIPRFYGRGDAALSAASSAGQESPVGGEVPGLGPDSRARDGLEQLLRSLFGEHGLRGFMRAIPGAEGVDDELPGATASLVQLASAAVQALHERGLIERALFERLVGERPHRRGDIARTAALWNIEL
jgi:hypothetical protein